MSKASELLEKLLEGSRGKIKKKEFIQALVAEGFYYVKRYGAGYRATRPTLSKQDMTEAELEQILEQWGILSQVRKKVEDKPVGIAYYKEGYIDAEHPNMILCVASLYRGEVTIYPDIPSLFR